MAFNLHKTPRGLLELFRLRTLGANPLLFGEQVVPMVETRDFYAADILSVVQAPAAIGALLPELESAQTFASPVGLRGLSLGYIQGAAAGTNFSFNVDIQIFVPSAAAFQGVTIGRWDMPALAAGQVVRCGVEFRGVLPAGGRFSAHVSGTAAGADHQISARALIEDFTVL